jgi:hypothetical protein
MRGESHVLPGGLILDDDRRLTRVELRPLTGFEEEWIAGHPDAPSAEIATHLLSACVVRLDDATTSRDLVQRLLVGDRDYVILQLRRITLGDRIQAVFACPACGAKLDVTFSTDAIPVERRPQEVGVYDLSLDCTEGCPRTVRFRLPRGADQECVASLDADTAVRVLLERCVQDDGGTPLSDRERDAVIAAMDQLAPKVEVELELACTECAHCFVESFDTSAFFFGEMRMGGEQFVREIHWLALYYHWSEEQILALTRARRRKYLSILADTLDSPGR